MSCWFFRLMISGAADADRPVGPLTSRHVARCEGCRQFQRSCRLLDTRLRSEATGLKHPCARFPGEVLTGAGRTDRRRHVVPVRLAVAVAACIAGLTFIGALILPRTTEPHQPPAEPIYATAPIDVDLDLAAVWTRVVERPLAGEIGRLRTDTESGVRFLVACLSVTPLTSDATPQIE